MITVQNESVTKNNAISIVCVFIIGSSLVLGINTGAGQDSWISFLLSGLIAAPVFIIYARIIKLYPGKDIFEIITELFGKFFAKLFIVLLSLYALHLASIVLKNFSEFIEISAMPETPQIPIMLAVLSVVLYMVKSGATIMGKFAVISLFFIALMITVTILFSFEFMDFGELLPFMEHKIKLIGSAALDSFSFPFCEIILFLAFAGSFSKETSPYKILLTGEILGTILLLLALIRNITVIGVPLMKISYFPSFTASRVLGVVGSFERIESTISINLLFGALLKISVCVYAASRGAAKLFSISSYKTIVAPVILMTFALSTVLYENVMQMFAFVAYYKYYAFPFQVIIPLIIWITAEIRHRKNKPKQKELQNDESVVRVSSKLSPS